MALTPQQQEQVKLFRTLINKGISPDKAKNVVTKMFSGQEVKQETPIASTPEEKKAQSLMTIQDTEMDISKLKDEQKDQSFLNRRTESLKEAVSPEGLIGAGVERGKSGIESFKEGDILKGIGKTGEAGLQIAGGAIGEAISQGLATFGEATLKQYLETLSPTTLETVAKPGKVLIDTVSKVGNSPVGKYIRDNWNKIPENIRNDIEAGLNVVGGSITKKGGQLAVKEAKLAEKNLGKLPFTQGSKLEKIRLTEKKIRDNVNAFLTTPAKVDDSVVLDLGKLIKKKEGNLRFAKDYDELGKNLEISATEDMKKLDNGFKKIVDAEGKPKTFKRLGFQESLDEMITGAEKIGWNTTEINNLKLLRKKYNDSGLTLMEENQIKKRMNDYRKGWTNSGKEGSGVKAETARAKYQELKKAIENDAASNGFKDVAELNRDWFVADTFSDIAKAESRKAGKQGVEQKVFSPGLVSKAKSFFSLEPKAPAKGAFEKEKNLSKFMDEIVGATDKLEKLNKPGIFEFLIK